MTAPKRRWFRATGCPIFEAFLALLLLIGAMGAVAVLIVQLLR